MTRTTMILAAAAMLAATACADDSSGAGTFQDTIWNTPDSGGTTDTGGQPTSDVTSDTSTGPDTPPPPPEDEQDFDLRTPEAGATRLYVPSAGLDALVVVDAIDLSVTLVDAGSQPVLVRALPGDQGAVVLNAGSHDVTLVRPAGQPGQYATTTVDVPPFHNRLALSPDGAWAFAWYTPTTGLPVGSLADVSAIRTAPGQEEVLNVAVGVRPEAVMFDASGSRAYVLCEDGISVVDLAILDDNTFVPPIPLHDDLFTKPNDREVVLTPSGAYAVVRDLDRAELTLVDLAANQRRVLSLPDWPSDLDITPDGARVVVTMRTRQEVAILDVPAAWDWIPPDPEPEPDAGAEPEADAGGQADAEAEIIADIGPDPAPDVADGGADADDAGPDVAGDTTAGDAGPDVDPDAGPQPPMFFAAATSALEGNPNAVVSFTGQPFGVAELTADGSRALLYTTLGNVLAVGLLDLASGDVGTRPLAKAVKSAAIAPDGALTILIHKKDSGLSQPEKGSHGYTLLDLSSGYAKPALTDSEPTEVVFTEDGAELYILLPDPIFGSHEVQRVTNTFAVTPYALAQAPVYLGVMPAAGKIAVMLDDPTGWLTLIEVSSGDVDQINSFELNSFIQ